MKSEEEKLVKRFEKACADLNAVLVEWRKIHPEGEYYLANDNLNLMYGPSHDDSVNCRAQKKNVAAQVWIPRSGGGDW